MALGQRLIAAVTRYCQAVANRTGAGATSRAGLRKQAPSSTVRSRVLSRKPADQGIGTECGERQGSMSLSHLRCGCVTESVTALALAGPCTHPRGYRPQLAGALNRTALRWLCAGRTAGTWSPWPGIPGVCRQPLLTPHLPRNSLSQYPNRARAISATTEMTRRFPVSFHATYGTVCKKFYGHVLPGDSPSHNFLQLLSAINSGYASRISVNGPSPHPLVCKHARRSPHRRYLTYGDDPYD